MLVSTLALSSSSSVRGGTKFYRFRIVITSIPRRRTSSIIAFGMCSSCEQSDLLCLKNFSYSFFISPANGNFTSCCFLLHVVKYQILLLEGKSVLSGRRIRLGCFSF